MSFPNYQEPPAPRRLPPISGTVMLFTALGLLLLVYSYRMGSLDRQHVIFLVALVPAVILHEISHGALANLWGDNTAKVAGRLTLNPLRHIDPFGTIIIPVVLIFAFGTAFGYAKPVPVNTSRMTRNKAMMVGLIGPITNIALALSAALFIHLFFDPAMSRLLLECLLIFGLVNVNLAVFNLIPIPPLDGSSVIERFLPERYMAGYYKFRQYSMFILLFIMLSGALSLQRVFDPAQNFWYSLLPGGA